MPTLSVIVPATNEPPTLPACADAIGSAIHAPDEVIVVSDPAFVGPAAARNEGARTATGDVLVFVDSDVVVHRDAFDRIKLTFDGDPSLVALFGSYDATPAANGVVSDFRNLLHHFVHQQSPGETATFWAGLGAIRRADFLAVGGFDSKRYSAPSVEDIELGMRLAAAGKKIVLDPAVQGTHLKRWSLGQMLNTDLRRRGVPWVRLLLERRSGSMTLNLGWRHRLSAAAAVLGLGALVTRRAGLAAGTLLGLVTINRAFYGLLWRRQGPLRSVAGVGLHALHHLTAVAAVPIGIVGHLIASRRDDSA